MIYHIGRGFAQIKIDPEKIQRDIVRKQIDETFYISAFIRGKITGYADASFFGYVSGPERTFGNQVIEETETYELPAIDVMFICQVISHPTVVNVSRLLCSLFRTIDPISTI